MQKIRTCDLETGVRSHFGRPERVGSKILAGSHMKYTQGRILSCRWDFRSMRIECISAIGKRFLCRGSPIQKGKWVWFLALNSTMAYETWSLKFKVQDEFRIWVLWIDKTFTKIEPKLMIYRNSPFRLQTGGSDLIQEIQITTRKSRSRCKRRRPFRCPRQSRSPCSLQAMPASGW